MPEPLDEQTRWFQDDLARKQYRVRGPEKINDVLSRLLSQRGYAQIQAVEQWQEAWLAAAGMRLADHTRVGNLKRGVLEVMVRNSTVMQELTFQKKSLLSKLQQKLGTKVKELKFKVGTF